MLQLKVWYSLLCFNNSCLLMKYLGHQRHAFFLAPWTPLLWIVSCETKVNLHGTGHSGNCSVGGPCVGNELIKTTENFCTCAASPSGISSEVHVPVYTAMQEEVL